MFSIINTRFKIFKLFCLNKRSLHRPNNKNLVYHQNLSAVACTHLTHRFALHFSELSYGGMEYLGKLFGKLWSIRYDNPSSIRANTTPMRWRGVRKNDGDAGMQSRLLEWRHCDKQCMRLHFRMVWIVLQ